MKKILRGLWAGSLCLLIYLSFNACQPATGSADSDAPFPRALIDAKEAFGLRAQFWQDSIYFQAYAFQESHPTFAYLFDSARQVVLLARLDMESGQNLGQIAFADPAPGVYLLQVYTEDGYLLTQQLDVYP